MDKEKFDKIRERIHDGLRTNHKKDQKMFWYGFIVSLHDFGDMTFEQYRSLRDDIDCWGK